MEATHPVSTHVSDYLGMLRRHWWVVLLVTAGAVGAADAVTRAMPRVYESSTSVLVQPAGQDTNVVGGRTRGDINLDTEAQLVRSTAVAAGAAQLLRDRTPPDLLAREVVVEVPPNTSVLVITYAAADPRRAQAGSHAFAEAYLRNRQASAQAELNAQITALSTKVKQLNSALEKINKRLAGVPGDSPDRPNLESQRQTSTNQVNNLAGDLNRLTTATVSAGKIISDARVPVEPSKPNRVLNLATGLMVGLLSGIAVAALRERLDRRIRRGLDVVRWSGVPVLAELNPRSTPRLDDVLPPYGPGGRVFNRLRNEVLAGLPADAGGRADASRVAGANGRERGRPTGGGKVLVVTGASPGPVSTVVAANLAAALARTGNDVVLVGAHLPESVVDAAPLAKLMGVSATPGLSDIIAGRVDVAEAAQRAARVPYLRVITTGGTATAAGLMQAHALRETFERLRGEAEYVVVEAPSTATSADAQSLASLADAAILAVELRRTQRPQVTDAEEQLRRVGIPLLGAIVLPRVVPRRPGAPAPAPGRPVIPLGPDGVPRPSGGPAGMKKSSPGGTARTAGPGAGRPAGPGTRPPAGRTPPGPAGGGAPGGGRSGAAPVAADVTAPLPRMTGAAKDHGMAETTVLRRVESAGDDGTTGGTPR
jgi:capsular polysaccharide biosynthesis protein/Mrp family chromosome partitioning ATPase